MVANYRLKGEVLNGAIEAGCTNGVAARTAYLPYHRIVIHDLIHDALRAAIRGPSLRATTVRLTSGLLRDIIIEEPPG